MHTAIRWFANNPVAANLLMVLLIAAGLFGALTTKQEEFPSIDVKAVSIRVPYLGAAPIEVEKSVCVRIEEAIQSVEGIDKLRTTAVEGSCQVFVELEMDADEVTALNEIKSQVDGINSFPVETEKPIVSKVTLARRVVQVAMSGNTDERTLKLLATELRDDLAAEPSISQVAVDYARPYEISIEVSELELRRFGITLDQVSRAIRNSSLDMPGGTIKTQNGEILIRTTGQAYWGEEFEDVVVLTRPDGTRVYLSDIATIRDTFEEGDLKAEFNATRSVMINVSQVGSEDLIQIAADSKLVIERFESTLPAGIYLNTWIDTSEELRERMSVLMRNALGGLMLVLVVLALFLKFRLAMWVAIGIPVALLGTLGALPFTDINISTMTVMAFILVLGIVVDDAIVVGERVYGHEQMGKPGLKAAVEGTWEVSVPVIFGVLTTIAAFLPLIAVEGRMSGFFAPLGWVVIFALICSIIESQLILPSHLAHRKTGEPTTGASRAWNNFQGKLAAWLERIATHHYQPFVTKVVRIRYISAATGVGILILALALIMSGRVVFGFFPAIEGDRIYGALEMPEGVSSEVTLAAAKQIEDAARKVDLEMTQELGLSEPFLRNVFVSVGKKVDRDGPGRPSGSGRSNLAEVVIEIVPASIRGDNINADYVVKRWRDAVGNIPDAVSVSFDSATFSVGSPIEYQLQGRDIDRLRIAAEDMKAQLTRYTGVYDISDSFRSGKQEIQLSLLPEARNLGLTLSDLASQVRAAFYGNEAQRVQRGKDDVRVMVRFPESERRSIGNLEDMYIRTPDGNQVPFYSVAKFELRRGFSSINRLDARRTVTVDAEVDRAQVSPEEVAASIRAEMIPRFKARYPDITVEMGGEQEERTTALTGLAIGCMFSLLVIYGLLAIPLRSYLQPLVVMGVIPFGAVGAIVGHFILDVQLMFFSALGIVALSGVVVNASLVLVDYANRQRREGVPLVEAIINAAVVRFRPILLTSVTTFVGLIPLMSTVTPATGPFLPMAISLAWGVLFATFITLLLVPCAYLIVEDWVHTWESFKAWMFGKPKPQRQDSIAEPVSGG